MNSQNGAGLLDSGEKVHGAGPASFRVQGLLRARRRAITHSGAAPDGAGQASGATCRSLGRPGLACVPKATHQL
jgi:hypothetical protein